MKTSVNSKFFHFTPLFGFTNIYPVLNGFQRGFKDVLLNLSHKGGHKGKVYFASLSCWEKQFFSFYPIVVYLPVETVFLGQAVDEWYHKKIGVLVQSFPFQSGNMVARHKLILVKKGTSYTAAIGYGQAVGELSHAAFIAHKSVHSVVECSSGNIWRLPI